MLSDLERWVLFMEMRLEASKSEAPTVWLDEQLNHLLFAIDAGDAVYVMANETAAVRARAYKFYENNKILVLLLNYADKNISDPVFENLETGALRREPKLDGEGVAVSAHIAIDLKSNHPAIPLYNVTLEDAPGIGKTKIRPFLNSIFRKAPRLRFQDPEGRERKYYPKVDFSGKMSAHLKDSLKGKEVLGIELVRHKVEDDEWDSDGLFRTERQSLKLKPTKPIKGTKFLRHINEAKNAAANRGYSDVRVVWSPVTGTQRSAHFGTAREDAGDVLTMRTERIHVKDSLAQCEDKIRDDVAKQLVKYLNDERKPS